LGDAKHRARCATAGQLSVPSVSSLPTSKICTIAVIETEALESYAWAALSPRYGRNLNV
jgi:hypothetical protein